MWASTQVTAAIAAADVAAAGSGNVTVTNPAPGGGTSSGASFAINNPSPTVTSLSPTSTTAGSAAFTLTVTGSSFISSSQVQWNGSNRTTTYVSATQLTAAITAADVASAALIPVTVVNPSPGGGMSTAASFAINNPVPTLAGMSPASANAGAVGFTLTLTGGGFNSESQAQWNGNNRPTTYTGSQLLVVISAADIASGAWVPVTVVNPGPGGGASSTRDLFGLQSCADLGRDFTLLDQCRLSWLQPRGDWKQFCSRQHRAVEWIGADDSLRELHSG